MSPKAKPDRRVSSCSRRTSEGALSVENLLRSINVVYDVAEPTRVVHFRPTGKSVGLVRALLGLQPDAAFVVVAPYGSAKSLASTFCAQVVENRSDAQSCLALVAKRIALISPDLARKISLRLRSPAGGVVVALTGPITNLCEALRSALLESLQRTGRRAMARRVESVRWESVDDFVDFVGAMEDATPAGPDRILLVWDEFGRHLESLVAGGRAGELNDLQTIAEFAARSRSPRMTVALLMHQPLAQYAGSAPQGVRNEWSKIAGRFETLEFVDDSRETYRLLSETMQARCGRTAVVKRDTVGRVDAAAAKRLGLFGDLPDETLQALVSAAAPMHATALWLLPRTSARVAQNERTLFTFLGSIDPSSVVGLAEIYDYFAPVMRGDMGTGGSYRQYLEAESAITKCANVELGAQAIKCACLLGLGLSGSRACASRELVEFALSAYCEARVATAVISELVKRKLLLHRKHSNELSVWHGTDADLRGRLESEMVRRSEPLNVVAALNAELPPPVWKPVRYNDDFQVTRFYRSEYRRVSDLVGDSKFLRPADAPFADGHVIYLIPESEAECEHARERAMALTKGAPNLVVCVPGKPLRISMPLCEIDAIHSLQREKELVESDPLISSELQQMLEDARAHVQRTMDAILIPDGKSAHWFADGRQRTLGGLAGMRELLSQQMQARFPLAPRIANELIVRRRPSPVVVNARKKLVLAILERAGKETLGISGKGADHSMFRSLLLNTEIYRRQRDDAWRFAEPEEIRHKGIREVWREFKDFVSTPATEPKSLGGFFAKLQAPPFGVRDGVIPVLFAAALKGFPAPVTLSRQGEYVRDILPSTIEDLCRNPEEYRFTVLDLGTKECAYLCGVHQLFSGTTGTSPSDGDLVRLAFESVGAWTRQLPPASLKTYRVSPAAKKLRDAVHHPGDALVLLLNAMPRAVGQVTDLDKAVDAIRAAKTELEEVPRRFEMSAAEAVRRSLGVADVADRGLRSICAIWLAAIPQSIREQLKANRDDPRPGALVERMMIQYESDDQLLQSLCSLVADTRPSRWEDTTPAVFARSFDDTVRRIEGAAVEAAVETKLSDSEKVSMARLGQARLRSVLGMLSDVVGRNEAARLAQQTIQELDSRLPG